MRGIFFFQAEDGIRDDLVTGVQTCALPISIPERGIAENGKEVLERVHELDDRAQLRALEWVPACEALVAAEHSRNLTVVRSEERRVGKECRSRWSPYH